MRAIFLGIVTLALLSLSRPAEARRRKPPAEVPASTEGAQEAGAEAATATGPEATSPGAAATRPCSEDDLNENIGRGLGAWESWSDKTWTRALTDVRVSLACQAAPVSPDTAANLHRALGLDALVNKQMDLAVQHFKTAALLEPGYRFSEKILQPGNRFDQAWQSALTAPLPILVPLDVERGTELVIDGAPATELYMDRPHYVQVFVQPKGNIASFILPVGGTLDLASLDGYREAKEEQARLRRLSNRLFVTAGGALVIAGGFEGAALRLMPAAQQDREVWRTVFPLHAAALLSTGVAAGIGGIGLVVRR